MEENIENINDLSDIEEEIIEEISDFGESNDDDDDDNQDPTTSGAYIAKDCTEWRKEPVYLSKRTSANIIKEKQGPAASISFDSRKSIFKQFISNEVMDLLVKYTNKNGNESREDWKDIDTIELDALIAGVTRSRRVTLHSLWSQEDPFHLPIFAASLSKNRAQELLTTIRFDDAESRNNRQTLSYRKEKEFKSEV